MGKPAARLADPTAHGGTIVGPGVPTVLIGKMPAATMGDNHVCPMATPATPPIPHVGGPVILGSTGVFIGKKPAARMGDMAVCVGPPSSIVMGCPTVLIGEVGSGSQAGSAGSAAAAQAANLKDPKSVAPVKPSNQKPPATVDNEVHMQFRDKAGKPLEGVYFTLKDPESQTIVGTSRTDGDWRRSGYAQAGSYQVEVPILGPVQCDKKRLAPGDTVGIKTPADGYAEGAEAWGALQVVGSDGQCTMIERFQSKVAGGRIEAKCTFTSQHADTLDAMGIQTVGAVLHVQIGAAFQSVLSDPLEIGPRTEKLELRFAEIPTACWAKDSVIPRPDEGGLFFEALRRVLRRASETATEELCLFSHAKADDSPASFRLSDRRADLVKSLLERNPRSWQSLAFLHGTEDDAKALLQTLSDQGWEVDPKSDPDAKLPDLLRDFLEEFSDRYDAPPPSEAPSELDLPAWGALHRALCGVLAETVLPGSDPDSTGYPGWKIPHWCPTLSAGTFACGKSFAVDFPNKSDWKSDGFDRVELVLASAGKIRPAPPKGTADDLKKADYPVFDPDHTKWSPLLDVQVAGFRFSS